MLVPSFYQFNSLIYRKSVHNFVARSHSLAEKVAALAYRDSKTAVGFQFLNLGNLAYTSSGSLLPHLTPSPGSTIKGKGTAGLGLKLY